MDSPRVFRCEEVIFNEGQPSSVVLTSLEDIHSFHREISAEHPVIVAQERGGEVHATLLQATKLKPLIDSGECSITAVFPTPSGEA